MHILITGGLGYIGSHMIALLQKNIKQDLHLTIIDNFSNSNTDTLKRLRKLCPNFTFIKGDVCELADLNTLFIDAINDGLPIDTIIHFAGLKSVSESSISPETYYQVNVGGTNNLLCMMKKYSVKNLIFSSSATVYGQPDYLPLDEQHEASLSRCTNPYGKSKLMAETLLTDFQLANPEKSIAILRYFNPVGAHPSGFIGEQPRGIPNNLMPYLCDAALGKRDSLAIFGQDYNTPDGTGIRDYIHVVDLVEGHLAALQYLNNNKPCCEIFNLGTGTGISVLSLIHYVERVNNISVPYHFAARRTGDVGEVYADNQKAKNLLGWTPQLSVDEMVLSHFQWCVKNQEKIR